MSRTSTLATSKSPAPLRTPGEGTTSDPTTASPELGLAGERKRRSATPCDVRPRDSGPHRDRRGVSRNPAHEAKLPLSRAATSADARLRDGTNAGDTVRQLHTLAGSMDVDGLARLLAPDVVMELPYAPRAAARRYDGLSEVLEFQRLVAGFVLELRARSRPGARRRRWKVGGCRVPQRGRGRGERAPVPKPVRDRLRPRRRRPGAAVAVLRPRGRPGCVSPPA